MSTCAVRIVLVAAFVVAGCGSGGSNHSSAPPTSPAATPAPSSAAPAAGPEPCSKGARAFWLRGPHGSRLEANSYGSGSTAVVFLHEINPAGMCGFSWYAEWLSRHYPVRAVLVNRCGYGASTCARLAADPDTAIRAQTRPAVAWARAHGATRVALLGASAGGGDALQAASVIRGIAAVADISGAVTDTGANNAAVAKRLRVPALFAVAPHDSSCPVGALRGLYRSAPAPMKRFVLVASQVGVHGWNLLTDADGHPYPLAKTVASWILR